MAGAVCRLHAYQNTLVLTDQAVKEVRHSLSRIDIVASLVQRSGVAGDHGSDEVGDIGFILRRLFSGAQAETHTGFVQPLVQVIQGLVGSTQVNQRLVSNSEYGL